MFNSSSNKANKAKREDHLPTNKTGARIGVSFAGDVDVENVCVKFGDKSILSDVSVKLGVGQVLALLGPSGSGKSTLLRVIAGLSVPYSGSVSINGNVVTKAQNAQPSVFLEPENRGIGFVFQDHALFPHLNVLDNVSFGLRNMSPDEKRAIALGALARVGLADRAKDWPHALSGGEQQRVAMARTLAPRPPIILMDEPFSGLDARLRDQVREDTLQMIKEAQASVVLVTHDPEEAMGSADQICLLQKGRVFQSGTPADLYARPKSLFAAEFFSNVSKFEGVFKEGALHTIFGAVPANRSANGAAKSTKDGAKGILCVRETCFEISQTKQEGFVLGSIVSRRFVGSDEVLHVKVKDHDEPVLMRVSSLELIAGNKEIWVRPKLGQCLVFESAP